MDKEKSLGEIMEELKKTLPPKKEKAVHEHKYVHLSTNKKKVHGHYNSGWIHTYTFFCETCLEYKDTTREEWSRDQPSWY